MAWDIFYQLLALTGLLSQGAIAQGCHCVNKDVAVVRTSACGDVYKEHTYGACWVATGNTTTCLVGGTEVEVMQIDYGIGRAYWVEVGDVQSAPVNCTKYTGTCSDMVFVTREEWGARDPTATESILTPFSMEMVHHTAGQSCYTYEECIVTVKGIQDFHMDVNGWDDIGYNFLVGEDGRVYEGRGWEIRGAHARSHNAWSHGLCIIGTFTDHLPYPEAMNQLNDLIACGVEQGYITQGHELFGHRDGVCTECPGDRLYEEIQTWPSFSTRDIPIDC